MTTTAMPRRSRQPRPVAGPLRRAGSVVGRRLLGVAFLLVLAVLLGLSVATYDKAFTPVVPVTLRTDHVGNQLQAQSDVKLRGIVVGSVRKVSSDGSGARVELALDPDMVDAIPANVQARLLPKTLFGERYVSLVIPPNPSAAHLRAHDVIPQDRSATAVELERVFADVLPLLRTLRPDKLNATLTALSTALQGRGEQLGHTLSELDTYLRRIAPSVDTLVADVRGLADTADVYSAAAPDLLGVLANLRTTSATIVDRQHQLAALLQSTAGLADTGQAVLAENAQRIIAVSAHSRPLLQLLARYAPEYPCLLTALSEQEPLLEDVFGGKQPGLHITLEVIRDRGKYVPGDEPQYVAHSGPDCHGLPTRPGMRNYNPGVHIPDGSAATGSGLLGRADSAALLSPLDLGVQGSAAERRWVDAIVAPTLGVAPDEVPGIADLLFAPMARGTEVHLS